MSELDPIAQLMNNNHREVCERLTAIETKVEDLPKRVGKLERQMSWIKGAGYVFGSIGTGIAAWFGIHKGI